MRVIVACEYSGRVREAFRELGHDAWSCDILESEDDSEFHIQTRIEDVINDGWDLMVAHPPRVLTWPLVVRGTLRQSRKVEYNRKLLIL